MYERDIQQQEEGKGLYNYRYYWIVLERVELDEELNRFQITKQLYETCEQTLSKPDALLPSAQVVYNALKSKIETDLYKNHESFD